MSMKRLVLATSVLALGLGGAAFAQNSNSTSAGAGAMGSSSSRPSYAAPSNSSDQGTSGSGMSGADVNGSSANGGPMASNSATGTGHATRAKASSSSIKEAQEALQSQGLYKGQVDGKWGPETRHAVAQFQKEKGLKQTAQLDQQTLNDLQNGAMSGSDDMSSSPNRSAPMNNGSMNSGGSGNMSVGPGAANGAATQSTNPGGQNRGGSTMH